MTVAPETGPVGHLAFSVAGRAHALPLLDVQEVLHLPALRAPEAMPSHVAGYFTLRGEVIAVLDVAQRLGLAASPPRASDVIIVLAGRRWAIRVEEIDGDLELDPPPPQDAQPSPFVRSLAAKGTQLYHLLDLEALLGAPALETPSSECGWSFEPRELALMEARAEAYLAILGQDPVELRTVLAFDLNGESFAVDLHEIREIAPCPPIHPLPGGPIGCVGLVSHRGEPLLVVDLCPALDLPQCRPGPQAKLLVVDDDGGRLGILATEVREVLRLDTRELHPPLLEHGPGEWVEGEWVVADRPISLLRLTSLLAQPAFMS